MWYAIPGHLEVQGGKLSIGGIEAEKLATRYGTPLYVYNGGRVVENFKLLKTLLDNHSDRQVRIYYPARVNPSLAVMKVLALSGAWCDVASPNEARLALDAGFVREKIMFTGTSVSDADLQAIAKLGITINIDSFSEMRRLAKLGRFRVSIWWNPGAGAGHHGHGSPDGEFAKSGIPEERVLEAFREARRLGLEPVALRQHSGTDWQRDELDLFMAAADRTLHMASKVRDVIEHDLELVGFDGGPGIPYTPDDHDFPLEEYASGLCRKVKESGLNFGALAVEPGRYLVGDAGILLTRINTVEEKGVHVMGLDSGFNTLLMPALNGTYNHAVICGNADGKADNEWIIAGNLCDPGDVFNVSRKALRPMPTPQEGDVLAILNAGAYGFSMSSRYNLRSLPAEALVMKGKDVLIRKREVYGDMLRGQIV